MDKNTLLQTKIGDLFVTHPYTKDFFIDHLIPFTGRENKTVEEFFIYLDLEVIEENAINVELFINNLVEYIVLMATYFVSENEVEKLSRLAP